VDDVLNDRETTIKQLTEQRDTDWAGKQRLIEENHQMRALIHTLTR
jgi:hypothetical protein